MQIYADGKKHEKTKCFGSKGEKKKLKKYKSISSSTFFFHFILMCRKFISKGGNPYPHPASQGRCVTYRFKTYPKSQICGVESESVRAFILKIYRVESAVRACMFFLNTNIGKYL